MGLTAVVVGGLVRRGMRSTEEYLYSGYSMGAAKTGTVSQVYTSYSYHRCLGGGWVCCGLCFGRFARLG